jgi:hypothetical protein
VRQALLCALVTIAYGTLYLGPVSGRFHQLHPAHFSAVYSNSQKHQHCHASSLHLLYFLLACGW